MFSKKTKDYIENHYWLEFLRWVETAPADERAYYELVATEDGEVIHWSIKRNQHNFWYWFSRHHSAN